MVATSFKYREDMGNEQVYSLQESALDQVEIYSNNLAFELNNNKILKL